MNKLFLILSTAFIMASCNGDSLPNVGGTVTVQSECLAASSEASYDEMMRVSRAMDNQAMNALVASGKVAVLPKLRKGTIAAKKFGKCQIKTEIAGMPVTLWTANENLK